MRSDTTYARVRAKLPAAPPSQGRLPLRGCTVRAPERASRTRRHRARARSASVASERNGFIFSRMAAAAPLGVRRGPRAAGAGVSHGDCLSALHPRARNSAPAVPGAFATALSNRAAARSTAVPAHNGAAAKTATASHFMTAMLPPRAPPRTDQCRRHDH